MKIRGVTTSKNYVSVYFYEPIEFYFDTDCKKIVCQSLSEWLSSLGIYPKNYEISDIYSIQYLHGSEYDYAYAILKVFDDQHIIYLKTMYPEPSFNFHCYKGTD